LRVSSGIVTDHPKGATHVRPNGATGNAVFELQTG